MKLEAVDMTHPDEIVQGEAAQPLLAVVTVTLDNLDGLRETVRSVEEGLAARPDVASAIEVIVKDGGSSDGTSEFLERLSLPGLRVAQGPDGGIYPAMNAALGLVAARWVIFLNAGDCFASPDMLGHLVDRIGSAGDVNFIYSDWIFGDCLLEQTLSISFLTSGMINHQSTCFRRDLLRDGYDTRYRYSADYAHLLAVYPDLKAEKLLHAISNCDDTGISSDPRNYHRIWRERLLAVWRSPLSPMDRMRLSRRGIFMWPIQRLRALVG